LFIAPFFARSSLKISLGLPAGAAKAKVVMIGATSTDQQNCHLTRGFPHQRLRGRRLSRPRRRGNHALLLLGIERYEPPIAGRKRKSERERERDGTKVHLSCHLLNADIQRFDELELLGLVAAELRQQGANGS
jgi:hypothetical protein